MKLLKPFLDAKAAKEEAAAKQDAADAAAAARKARAARLKAQASGGGSKSKKAPAPADDDDEEEEEDDGMVRGKLTVEATDLDDEDDYELSASVSKGGLSAYEAGKQLERLRPMLYAQLQSFAAQIVESVTE